MVRANLGTDKSVPYKKLANFFNVLAVDFKIIKHGFTRIYTDFADSLVGNLRSTVGEGFTPPEVCT
ncbi:MAG: hypothetical protein FWG87_01390 [Defluviitaleaceae bacterium]|nr:hypothetical protein [Defluviitaleaceae bacterium]